MIYRKSNTFLRELLEPKSVEKHKKYAAEKNQNSVENKARYAATSRT